MAAASPAHPPIVLSEFGALDGTDAGVRSVPTFRRHDDFAAAILNGALAEAVDVVHIQHAPDIFGTDDRLARLCRMLASARIASVVTLHTVHSWGTGAWRGYLNVPAFHRRLGASASALVVHGESRAATTLRADGVPPDRVHVIPFGTPADLAFDDRTTARSKLGLTDEAAILVCVGFVRPGKRLQTLIKALHRLRRRVPRSRLILAGAVQNAVWRERGYAAYLRAMIRWYRLEDVVELREGFLSDEDVFLLHAAADLILLAYGQRYGSGSMALHTAVAARRLPICSRIPKFEEVAEHLSSDWLVRPGDADAWARAIERGLAEARQPETQGRLDAFANATSWTRVVARHFDLYQSVRFA